MANDQQGLVTLGQLEAVGMDRRTVAARAKAGRLHPVHAGVFAVGYPLLTADGEHMAAALACGPEAVISHVSAAYLWGFWKRPEGGIHITAPHRRGRSPGGIVAHRDGSLRPEERGGVRGIPCATPSRAILDMAATAPDWELRRAIGEAEALRLIDQGALRGVLRHHPGRRGVARLRLLADRLHPQNRRSRSELERMFLHVCLEAGLPQPEVNVSLRVRGRHFKPDFLWRDERLILEADSRRFHATDVAFANDRRREQLLQMDGWRVSHCAWEQVEFEPGVLAETVRTLLAISPGSG